MRTPTLVLLLGLIAAGSAAAQERRVKAYAIQSSAMEPTLRAGERVMADRQPNDCGQTDGITPGDVVMRRQGADRWIHRVVAGPGQTIEILDGLLVIDGQTTGREETGTAVSAGSTGRIFRETLPNGRSHEIFRWDGPASLGLDDHPLVRLGPDQWFLMGDHRQNAVDSRQFGPVPSGDICGVVTHLFFSTDPSRVRALR